MTLNSKFLLFLCSIICTEFFMAASSHRQAKSLNAKMAKNTVPLSAEERERFDSLMHQVDDRESLSAKDSVQLAKLAGRPDAKRGLSAVQHARLDNALESDINNVSFYNQIIYGDFNKVSELLKNPKYDLSQVDSSEFMPRDLEGSTRFEIMLKLLPLPTMMIGIKRLIRESEDGLLNEAAEFLVNNIEETISNSLEFMIRRRQMEGELSRSLTLWELVDLLIENLKEKEIYSSFIESLERAAIDRLGERPIAR